MVSAHLVTLVVIALLTTIALGDCHWSVLVLLLIGRYCSLDHGNTWRLSLIGQCSFDDAWSLIALMKTIALGRFSFCF